MSFDFDARETLAQHPKLLSALLTAGFLLSTVGTAAAVSTSGWIHPGP
jgi:hypothetical protein